MYNNLMNESPLQFPKNGDKERLRKYDYFDKIYSGDHYDAFSIKGEKNFTDAYRRLRYVVANFGGLTSRVVADMLFGENITVDFKNNDTQKWVDGLFEQNHLLNQFYESALGNSRRGDDVFKIRIGKRNPLQKNAKPEIIIEQIGPSLYFPEFDKTAARNQTTKDVIVNRIFNGNKVYLHKETHIPGEIYSEVYEYNPDSQTIGMTMKPENFGIATQEFTKIDRSLVFHVPNVRDATGFWGTSDYADLTPLFFALNNRLTKTDNILDKHSDPILAVPPGVINEDGSINKVALGMFEVDSDNPGFNKPEYIVWNANLEAAEKQIDKLLELLFMLSEIAPATMGMDKNGGQAESGRALKFKLLATIRKRNRKMRYYDQMIKDMLTTSLELGQAWGIKIDGISAQPERATIIWGDGVINDPIEAVETATMRIDAGLSSRADEISKLDNKTPDEARAKVKEIDEESAPALPAPSNKNGKTAPKPGDPATDDNDPEE